MIQKIKRLLWLNKFLIFNKNNWLRNYMLNIKKFEKLSEGDLYGDTEDLIDNLFTLSDSRLKQAFTNTPFNNQRTRTEIVDNIFNNEKFDEIIETGTLLGNTTEYFANKDIPVTSVEISELYFLISTIRFIDKKNINLINSDSSNFLFSLKPSKRKIFFYLDAHSQDFIPLQKELSHCLKFENSIILIDDFKVPENKTFGYDTYDSVELSIENYDHLLNHDLYFPNYDAKKDFNSRGYVFIDISGSYSNLLSNEKNLLKYTKTN